MTHKDFSLIQSEEPDIWDFKKHGEKIGRCQIEFLDHETFLFLEEEVMIENGLTDIINASENNNGICYLSWISINHKERGNKYGRILLNMTIELLQNKYDGYPIFLSATSFGKDLNAKDLVKFYSDRGFKALTECLKTSCYMFSENTALLKLSEKTYINTILENIVISENPIQQKL